MWSVVWNTLFWSKWDQKGCTKVRENVPRSPLWWHLDSAHDNASISRDVQNLQRASLITSKGFEKDNQEFSFNQENVDGDKSLPVARKKTTQNDNQIWNTRLVGLAIARLQPSCGLLSPLATW